MGVFAGPEIIESGLVLALDAGNTKSYPGSGTTWTDLSGCGNNGTLVNSPTYSSANGGSIVFDGSDDNVDVSDSSSLNFTDVISLSCWFNFTALPNNELGLFRKNNQWQLGLFNSNTIRCLIGTNGTTGWTAGNDVSYTFSTNTWYNMVMTYNGSNMLIYVNNSLVKTATVTGSIVTNTNKVQVGYHTVVLNGKISNCSIYNRALTASEIQQNFNATKSRFGL
ncbi:MAG: LamG domain-containing protein [Candidatus Nanopelagicaceae bacterium]